MRDNSDNRDSRDNSDTSDNNDSYSKNNRNNRDGGDNRLNREHCYSDTRDTCGHTTNTGHDMAHTFKAFSDGYIHNDRRTDANRRCAGGIMDTPKTGDNGVYHARVQQMDIGKKDQDM